MTEFRYLHGKVYIFENSTALRVKVGMTINDVADRLGDINDMWGGRKVTCQICGGRLIHIMGLVPQHVVSGRTCLGGNAFPLEQDVALAELHLENLKTSIGDLSGSEKSSIARKIKTLEKRIDLHRYPERKVGAWQLSTVFHTPCAEQVELLTHQILAERLDKEAPFGEVFCCSVLEAIEAVETALNKLGLLSSARKEEHSLEIK